LKIPQPENGTATSGEEAKKVRRAVGYQSCVRVLLLGGRAMAIVYDSERVWTNICARRLTLRRKADFD